MIKKAEIQKDLFFVESKALIFRGEFVRFTECFMNFDSARIVFSTEKHPASVKKSPKLPPFCLQGDIAGYQVNRHN